MRWGGGRVISLTAFSRRNRRTSDGRPSALPVTGLVLLVTALVLPLGSTPAAAHTRPAFAVGIQPAVQSISAGATANWVISIQNKGSVPLTGVSVSDPLAPACSKAFPGSLAPGAREPSYRCSKVDVRTKLVNKVRARAANPLGDSDVRFWGGSAKAEVEIVGLDVGLSCSTPVRAEKALACDYIVSVPFGYDTVTFYENQTEEQVESAGGRVTGPADLLASAPQHPMNGASCGSSSQLCTIGAGASIDFGPVSFYKVQAGDYQLPNHLLFSLFDVPWSAICDGGKAQCPGANEVSAASTVEPPR